MKESRHSINSTKSEIQFNYRLRNNIIIFLLKTVCIEKLKTFPAFTEFLENCSKEINFDSQRILSQLLFSNKRYLGKIISGGGMENLKGCVVRRKNPNPTTFSPLCFVFFDEDSLLSRRECLNLRQCLHTNFINFISFPTQSPTGENRKIATFQSMKSQLSILPFPLLVIHFLIEFANSLFKPTILN